MKRLPPAPTRLLILLILCVGALGARLPAGASAAPASAVTSAFMAAQSDCGGGEVPTGTPVSHFPSFTNEVCLFIIGPTPSDTITATIYDASGRIAWHSGAGFTGSTSAGVYFGNIDYGLAITGFWPDGIYRTDVNLNGPVVQSITWTVGDATPPTPVNTPVVILPTSTPAPVPPSNTPIPLPTHTPLPVATSTPRPHASNTPVVVHPLNTPIPLTPVPTNNCSGTIPHVVHCTEPSVLRIHVRLKTSVVEGSGFVVRADSTGTYVTTNLHVVLDATANQITLVTPDAKQTFTAQVVAANNAKPASGGDLAVLRIQPTHLVPLTWGDSSSLQAGDTVISIGYGLGLNLPGPPTVTEGIVSAVGRDLGDGYGQFWIQHQSIINHGNSGGPLLDLQGHVVGVNTLGIDQVPNGSGQTPAQGIFFAIPANSAKTVSSKLISDIIAGRVHAPQPVPQPVQPLHPAAFSGKGYQITLPPSWAVVKQKDGTPVFVSPDQLLGVYVFTGQVDHAPSLPESQGIVQDFAAQFSTTHKKAQVSISYKQFGIGPLAGTQATITVPSSADKLLVAVVSDGHHLIKALQLILDGATATDTQQSATTISTIKATNS